MKYIYTIIFVIILVGCDTGIVNAPDKDKQQLEVASIEDVGQVAKSLESHFNLDELNGKSQNKMIVSNRESELLRKILSPLKRKGLDFKEKVLENSLDRKADSEYLNKMTEEEMVMVGLLSVILEDADCIEKNCESLDNPLMAKSVDGDRIISCLATTTGYSSIKAAININGLMSARTLMTTVKAIGKRYLGYVGTAVFVYNFSKCMDLI